MLNLHKTNADMVTIFANIEQHVLENSLYGC